MFHIYRPYHGHFLRLPPIAPAKLRGPFAFDEFGDFAPEQTESHEPFAD
jgi:hypothetical protein